jgi:methionine-rich copper-binding protein CopC
MINAVASEAAEHLLSASHHASIHASIFRPLPAASRFERSQSQEAPRTFSNYFAEQISTQQLIVRTLLAKVLLLVPMVLRLGGGIT